MSQERMAIREHLKKEPLVFDGGMGTYYAQKTHTRGKGVELANIETPRVVEEIHTEYLRAGAQAIKTNTFAANCSVYQGDTALVERILRSGWEIAARAAEPFDAYVFADIGPVTGLPPADILDEYRFLVDTFLAGGARHFLFETNSSTEGLVETAAHIKQVCPEAFVLTSFSAFPGGYTRDGFFVEELIRTVTESGYIDAVGFNCVSGVQSMKELVHLLGTCTLPLSLMPNAGHPIVIDGRTFYESAPDYFGDGLAALVREGVSIVGGCCGTTPEHIRALCLALADSGRVSTEHMGQAEHTSLEASHSAFFEALKTGGTPIAVELDPPEVGNADKFMAGARELMEAGVHAITIADNPIARARMDAAMLAGRVQRSLGLEPIPHMTCRDRNLNAIKSILLGLSAEGVHNLIAITGDPIPTAERDEVKSVYQFNSRKLSAFIKSLGERGDVVPFHVFGALNVNSIHFPSQLGLAKKKMEAGMTGFFTQPVLSSRAKENLRTARDTLPGALILGGIMPVVSERNARFMESEISGIHVEQRIIDAYHGLDREAAEELAVQLSLETAKDIEPYIDGYYIITPFARTALVARIVKELRRK
ncbi:bifunctional homocysteine S-methyltransferase/methylenetetrahydrofolate reductase [Selenomonas sp. oral taxon 138]|uniref:bifunctional homocysteine S-methyltransferase/methylenetetrahydrofolate reductase n=1 Tax=Selenomonas sp. oral taxon 138 TaxID=712532 RepID=UPI0002A1D632|nr:bifunctional homocysteine S-methyltransferase/methylenetetrahydrofolate reductase [Selenomonas sp. oral taxon 138]EKX99767.1 putative homocysteine S-methyltransferase/5,10-methylenetetrahydrofolate reductase protein [Selenomonas sp. oral taxon 138 str. F0429]